MVSRTCHGWMLVSLLCLPAAAVAASEPQGIGVIGDSYSDEYQFYPPDRSTARNWVEILASTRGLNFGRFSLASRGEPRNQGYEYNWARSDATTASLLASGQHTGVAAQVARGEVSVVYVFIGGNDFIHALHSTDPLRALDGALPRALRNYRAAVETVRAASPDVKLVLGTLPDIRDLPEFAGPIREGRVSLALADAYTDALRTYNAQIRTLAAGGRAALIDLDLATRAANLLSRDHVLVSGLRLDRRRPANRLDHFFLADVRHPGTLGQGLMARMFIEVLNARFGMKIEPLGDREVLAFAQSLSPRDDAVRLVGTDARSPQAGPAAPPARVLIQVPAGLFPDLRAQGTP
jgi:phospholipase/lecithinase/hemolysin